MPRTPRAARARDRVPAVEPRGRNRRLDPGGGPQQAPPASSSMPPPTPTRSIAILDAVARRHGADHRSPHHQHSRPRGIPPPFLCVEGGEGGAVRFRHRRLCARHRRPRGDDQSRGGAEAGGGDVRHATHAEPRRRRGHGALAGAAARRDAADRDRDRAGRAAGARRPAGGAGRHVARGLRAAPRSAPLAMPAGAARSGPASGRRRLADGGHRLPGARAGRQGRSARSAPSSRPATRCSSSRR